MTVYRVSKRPRWSLRRKQKAQEKSPLEQVDSTDSGSDAPFDESPPQKSPPAATQSFESERGDPNVHLCKSSSCLVCRRPQNPRFLRCDKVDPNSLKLLPKRWWESGADEKELSYVVLQKLEMQRKHSTSSFARLRSSLRGMLGNTEDAPFDEE